MSAEVHDVSAMTLRDAREIAAHAYLYELSVVLDACAVLSAHGDWMDHERALAVQRSITDLEGHRRESRARLLRKLGEIIGDVIGAIALAGIVVGLIFLALLFSPN